MRDRVLWIFFIGLLLMVSCIHQSKGDDAEPRKKVNEEKANETKSEVSEEEKTALASCFESLCPHIRYDSWGALFKKIAEAPPLDDKSELSHLYAELQSEELNLLNTRLEVIKKADLSLLNGLSKEEQLAALFGIYIRVFAESIKDFSTFVRDHTTIFSFVLKTPEVYEKSEFPTSTHLVNNYMNSNEAIISAIGDIAWLTGGYKNNVYTFSHRKYGTYERAIGVEKQMAIDSAKLLASFSPSIRKFFEKQSFEKGMAKLRLNKTISNEDLIQHYAGSRQILIFSLLKKMVKDAELDFSEDFKAHLSKIDKEWLTTQIESLKDSLKESREEFLSLMGAYFEAYPTKKYRDDFDLSMLQVKKDIVEHLPKLVSGRLVSKINNKIENIHIFPPKTRDELIAVMAQQIRDKIGFIRKELAQIKSSPLRQLEVVAAYENNEKDVEDFKKSLDFIKINEDLRTNLFVSDVAYSWTSLIGASWMSLQSEGGISVLRHELGHKVFAIIQEVGFENSVENAKMTKITRCLNSMHKERSDFFQNPISALQVGFYLEEDFADFIAYSTGSHDPANLACFIHQDRDRTFFNEDPTDPHSSLIFRVLHHNAIVGSPLPEQCSSYLQKYHPDIEFKNCAL